MPADDLVSWIFRASAAMVLLYFEIFWWLYLDGDVYDHVDYSNSEFSFINFNNDIMMARILTIIDKE